MMRSISARIDRTDEALRVLVDERRRCADGFEWIRLSQTIDELLERRLVLTASSHVASDPREATPRPV